MHATVDALKKAEEETLTVEFKRPIPMLAASLHLAHYGGSLHLAHYGGRFAATNEDANKCKNCGKALKDHVQKLFCEPKMLKQTKLDELEKEIRKREANVKLRNHTLHVRRIDIHRCRPRKKHGDDYYQWALFPKNGSCQPTSSDEWAVLQTALNTHALNAQYRQTTARLINTPYRSDLDKWLLTNCCPSTVSGSYLKQVLDKWEVLRPMAAPPRGRSTALSSVPDDTGDTVDTDTGQSSADTGQSIGSSPGENEDGAAGIAFDGKLPAGNGNRESNGPRRARSISQRFSPFANEKSFETVSRSIHKAASMAATTLDGSTLSSAKASLEDRIHDELDKKRLKEIVDGLEGEKHKEMLCSINCCVFPRAETGGQGGKGGQDGDYGEYSSKCPAQETYVLDLNIDPEKCKYCGGRGGKDGGMFSGETILHIAIVQHRLDSIEWLLQNGARVDSRALGVFFQDSKVPKFKADENVWNKVFRGFRALARGRMRAPRDAWRNEPNAQAGVCYGEFPLSFAAAVGDEHVCYLLYRRALCLIQAAVCGGKNGVLVDNEELEELQKNNMYDEGEVRFLQQQLDKWIFRNVRHGDEVLKHLQDRIFKLGDEIRRLVKDSESESRARSKSPTGAGSRGAHAHLPMQHVSSKRRVELQKICYTHGFEEKTTEMLLKRYDQLAVWRGRYMKLLQTAFVNRRDSAGNTALHVAVEHRRKSTIDWLLDNGAETSLSFLNNDNLTPLTLAVRLGDADIFEHLLARQRMVVWSYGTVCLSKTSIEQIDTFRLVPENGTSIKPFKRPSFWRRRNLLGGSESKNTRVQPEDDREPEDDRPFKYLARERKNNEDCAIEHEHQDPLWRSALEVMVDHVCC